MATRDSLSPPLAAASKPGTGFIQLGYAWRSRRTGRLGPAGHTPGEVLAADGEAQASVQRELHFPSTTASLARIRARVLVSICNWHSAV